MQIVIVVVTIVLMGAFSLVIARTALGRAQRACEQDRVMASLLGINVDRTISMTFVMGAMLAAVAGLMFVIYYGVIDFFIGFLAGIKAFTAAVLGGIGSLPGAMLGGLLNRPLHSLLSLDRELVESKRHDFSPFPPCEPPKRISNFPSPSRLPSG